MGSSPALDQIFCVDFFRLYETFFRNFVNVSEGSTLHFFPILQKNGCRKTAKGPLLHFRYNATYQKLQKIQKIFGIFFGYCRGEYLTL